MSKRWTLKAVKEMKAAGVIRDYVMLKPVPRLELPKEEPKGLREMKEVLRKLGIEFREEYRFHSVRRFRFDIAIVERKIAAEYEGLMSEKSRHTTVIGYTRDAEKYNLAQAEGWTVLRYTVLNYQDFESDLLAIH